VRTPMHHVAQSFENYDVRLGTFKYGVKKKLADNLEWKNSVLATLRQLVVRGSIKGSQLLASNAVSQEALWVFEEPKEGFWVATDEKSAKHIVMRFHLLQWLSTDAEMLKEENDVPDVLRHEVTAYGGFPFSTPSDSGHVDVHALVVRSFLLHTNQLVDEYKWQGKVIPTLPHLGNTFTMIEKSEVVPKNVEENLDDEIGKLFADFHRRYGPVVA